MIAEIYVVDATPTPRAQKHIDECMKQGVCLCGCGRKSHRRGLADPCYYKFNREFNAMPKRKAAKYEANCIRRGYVLARGAALVIKRRLSVFGRVAQEVESA